MKKIFLALVVSFFALTSFAQTINISTGVDASGMGLGIGVNAAPWTVNSGAAYTVASYGSYWQPTPIPGCNARWINPTATTGQQAPGYYTFERAITVPPGTATLSLNFKVGYDDVLTSLELVSPANRVTPVTAVNPRAFYLSDSINIKEDVCKSSGVWKLRAKVQYIDALGAFMLCGTATLSGECCKIPDEKCNPDFKATPFTLNSQCNIVTDINPVIATGTEHYWGLVLASGPTDVTPIPLTTIQNGGSFGLSISSTGTVTPIGMGTGINASTSGYGYHYEGVAFGACFKVTHYIKCCNKWYSKTKTFCTKLCADTKESRGNAEVGEVDELTPRKKALMKQE